MRSLAFALALAAVPASAWVLSDDPRSSTAGCDAKGDIFNLYDKIVLWPYGAPTPPSAPPPPPTAPSALTTPEDIDSPEEVSTKGLKGGLTYAIHPQFCERMLPRFPEEDFESIENIFGFSFLDCDRIRKAIAEAFNTWAINHKYLHFEDVTTACWKSWEAAGSPSCESLPKDATCECPNAELLITTNDLWTPGVVNANSVHQGDYAAFVINGKKGTVAMERLPTRLTSGAVIDGDQGLQRSEMTVSTELCWYLDTTFCYQFHSMNDAEWDVVLFMRIVVTVVSIVCAGIFCTILASGLRNALCPSQGTRAESSVKKVFGRRTDAVLLFLARTPLFCLLFSLFWLIAAPVFYFTIFLPCWDCYDFKATLAHEVGHVLGFDHPDDTDCNGDCVLSARNLQTRAGIVMGDSVCQRPLTNDTVEWIPDADRKDCSNLPDGDPHDSIMFSVTKHRSRTCLTADDLEGLNFLYPLCGDEALTEPECLESLELSGYLRFTLAIGMPYALSTIILCLLQCCVSAYMRRRTRHYEQAVSRLRRDKSDMRRENAKLKLRLSQIETGEEPAPRHKIFGAFGRSSRSIISSLFTPRRAHTPNASPSKQEPVASTPLDSPTGEVDAEDLERMSMVRESVSEAHARFSTASQDVSARSSTRRSFSGMPSSDSGLRVDGTPRGAGSDSPALQAIAIDASPWLAKD